MGRISGYFISLLIVGLTFQVSAQDTINFPLHFRAGIDLFGPSLYVVNNNNLTVEGFAGLDITDKRAIVFEGGYQNYKYSQYNYNYQSKGVFFRAGIDFNFLNSFLAQGKHFAGTGLRYGISFFDHEFPAYEHENYWGNGRGSVSSTSHLAHFIEVDPVVRTELWKNISVGWSFRLKFLVYSGTGKDLKPVSIPGYGNGVKTFSTGINYYIIYNIPYKTTLIVKQPDKIPEKEPEPPKK